MNYRVAIGLIAVLTALGAAPAHGEDDRELARRLGAAGEILPLESILEKTRAVRSGEVLEIDLKRKASGYAYEVELLDAAGRVWELVLDARTGELLKIEEDD